MPRLAIADRVVSYEDYGSGPVVLLIHGSPGNSKVWSRVGERLSDRYRVIAPDLPGYGDTTPQPLDAVPDTAHAAAILETLIAVVGVPTVLAGHSYGAVVALTIALRGNVTPGALALFETVALRLLRVAGEAQAYESAKAVFDDYISSFEGGNDRAFQKIIDFWFGPGAFNAMPESVQAHLLKGTSSNIRDVQATFREEYSVEGLDKLSMPVLAVYGARSPEITRKMAQVIATHARKGSILCMRKANHALTATHVEEVAQIIGDLATNAAPAVDRTRRNRRAIQFSRYAA